MASTQCVLVWVARVAGWAGRFSAFSFSAGALLCPELAEAAQPLRAARAAGPPSPPPRTPPQRAEHGAARAAAPPPLFPALLCSTRSTAQRAAARAAHAPPEHAHRAKHAQHGQSDSRQASHGGRPLAPACAGLVGRAGEETGG